MIEVQNLSKSYGGIRAIDSLNFKIKKGEVVGFLGPNGAGKSTTMKILTGFMAPTSGSAVINGFDVFENPIEVKRCIGYLPETPPVYADMKVREYLRYVAKLKGVEKTEIEDAITHVIEKTQLGSVEKRLIHNLSKGFRQRVGIAQALVSNPEVLILDEPTVGLDPKQVSEIRELIQQLRGHHTIILSTHILPEVEATCERIIIINKGKIVAEDTLSNLSNLRSGGQIVNLRLKRPGEDTEKSLSAIGGVQKVLGQHHEWTLETQSGDDIIEKIAALVIQKGYGLLEISSAKADLEDIFLKLTYGAEL
jgi:ABC-2 type transport system ATP-binding protein